MTALSRPPIKRSSKKVVIAVVNGELVVRRISTEGGRLALIAENRDYKPLQVEEDMGFEVWGVVTNVIHPL